MNRRTFLQRSAAAGVGALVIGSALEACTRVAVDSERPIVGRPPFTLPPLPYPYAALAPHIDAETMRIHHTKHHQGYIEKLNSALVGHPQYAATALEQLFVERDRLPEALRPVVQSHGGGHYNHSLFWQCLTPTPTPPPKALTEALVRDFGSAEAFENQFAQAGLSVFGSGWVWLVQLEEGKLAVETTPNQENPLMYPAQAGSKLLLGLDVWEHAYYLNYQNRRADYLAAFWQVVNWGFVAGRLKA